MHNATRILIVEDLPTDYELGQREIQKHVNSCEFKRAERQGEFMEALAVFQPDLILSDYKLPDFDGMKALKMAQKHSPSVPVIIWTGSMNEDVAVECMKEGASNYVIKENLKRLGPAVLRALEERDLLLQSQRMEQKFRVLFENAMEGIFQSTPEGRYLSVNPTMARIYGYASPAEMIETVKDISSQIYVEPCIRRQFVELLRSHESITNFEMQNLRKDGTVIWTSTSARAVQDEDGNILYYEGFLQDITERKQIENAEREQRAMAEALRNTAETLSSTLDYGKVLDQILVSVGSVVPSDAATIMLLQEGKARVVGSRGYRERGLDATLTELELPVIETANLWQMLLTGKPMIVPDVYSFPNWQKVPAVDWIRSNVGAPICLHGDVIGFILLDSETPGFFTPLHTERLEAFANQAALAIHNSRLMKQAQEELAARKRTEDALRESEESFLLIAHNAEDMIWIMDLNLQLTYVSPAVERALGYPAAEILASTATQFVSPQSYSMGLRVFAEEIENFQVLPDPNYSRLLEMEYLRKDGSTFWVEMKFSFFRNENGYPTAVLGVGRDISARRQVEARMKDLLEFNEKILNHSPLGILTYKATGECISANEKSASILGTTVEELKRQNFHTIPAWRQSGLYDMVDRALSTCSAVTDDVHHKSTFGKEVWLRAHFVPFKSKEEDHILLTISDITDRRLAEDKLRESEGRYRALFENSPISIWEEDFSQVKQYLDSCRQQGITDFRSYFASRPEAVRECNKLIGVLDVNQTGLQMYGAQSKQELIENTMNVPCQGEYDHNAEDFIAIAEGRTSNGWEGTDETMTGEPLEINLRWSVAPGYENDFSKVIVTVIDITDRKQAEEAIREERQRFLDLFENSPIPTWLEDFSAVIAWMEDLRAQEITNLREYLEAHPEAWKYGVGLIRVLNVNHAAVIVNGARNKQELIGKIHEILNDDMSTSFMIHEFDMIWQGITSFGFELTSHRMDGSLVTGIQRLYIPINNNRPDYGRVIVTSTDITNRVEMERKLRTSELHYRELADSITDVLFELDQDLRYTHWNKASEELTGISAGDAIGRSMYELFGETEEQSRIGKIYRNVLEENQARTFETEIVIQGQKLVFEINANPSTRGVSVVARNITERKLSESLMQKRFELMEFAAHHSSEQVLQKTVDLVSELTGSHIGFMHFIENDQTTIKLQAWSTETLREFCKAEGQERHYSLENAGVWANAIRYRQPIIHNDYEALLNRKGIPAWHAKIIREMLIPIIRDERVVALVGVGNKAQQYARQDMELAERFADYAWDIAERKQMEGALAEERNQLARRVEERTADLSRANSNLARALRVKDEFLANMSHELRTPLNAILGLSESLGEQVAGPLNEKQQKYLSTINESGHHLLSLINDILDLAKIEAGQITLDLRKVDVNSVCQASLRMIKQLAQKKNQEVIFTIDPELGLIRADERRLKQMIVNLLSNAVKFSPESSKVGLEVQGNRAANKVIITVWDTGIGIQEEDLKRLFKPFVQLDSGLAREATGTGLGLALVAEMARLHGGSVHASSQLGKGSRFIVQLPWEQAPADDMATLLKNTGKFRALDPSINRPTILLIEDTREVVMMLVDYLEMAGYRMATAQDGVDGLAQAKLTHPDLILMDIQMPRMDGFEATQKIRSDPELKDIPIIALTALAMPNDRERCLDAGIDEYISKPVNLRMLTKLIQKLLLLRRAGPA